MPVRPMASWANFTLQVLEPALISLEDDSYMTRINPPDKGLRDISTNPDSKGLDSPSRESSGGASPTLQANRACALLAWRCLEAARTVARLLPPLSARALLPMAMSLPHSCAPSVRTTAGVTGGSARARYGGGDGARAGLAGWPLTVASVALRNLYPGATIATSWVDEEEDLATREEELVNLVPFTAVGDSCTEIPCRTLFTNEACAQPDPSAADTHAVGGGIVRRRGFGCGCAKCRVEASGTDGAETLEVKELIEAADSACREDR